MEIVLPRLKHPCTELTDGPLCTDVQRHPENSGGGVEINRFRARRGSVPVPRLRCSTF